MTEERVGIDGEGHVESAPVTRRWERRKVEAGSEAGRGRELGETGASVRRRAEKAVEVVLE
jgi:hypothetical protein